MSAFDARRFGRFAWAVLAYTLAVIVWGALVRATGSGAGCGNHWPFCTPPATTVATVIEFTHRAMTGLDAIAVLALVVLAFRIFPPGHAARLGAALSAVFLVTESLLGAALVKLEHVAQNASTGRLYSLSCHLVNTLALVACLALTAWWAGGRPRLRLSGKPFRTAVSVLAAVIVLGISGAIAALGDTLVPARSLAEALARDFDPAASIFLRLRLWHPLVAVLASAAVVWYARSGARADAAGPRQAHLVVGLVAAQIAAGVINLILLAPIPMQLLHLLLADLLWIALVLLCAARIAAGPSPGPRVFPRP
jgi:heme A synthase